MTIHSQLSAKNYISALKEQMDSHFALGAERFTGFFAGRCFCVTHHAGYEWNRKYTNQKNCAVGYVKQTDSGCEVRFLRFKGGFCPPQFIFLFLLILALLLFQVFLEGGLLINAAIAITLIGISLGASLLGAAIETFFESLTAKSEEGRKILIALLMDPDDPFSYLHNKDHIR